MRTSRPVASFHQHLSTDRRHLGKEFPEVHRWLDAFYKTHGTFHREKRHHWEGVEEVRTLWGDEAAKSAELHILLDMGHIPIRTDWEKRTSSTMDGMGRPAAYIDRFTNCDDVAMSIAFIAQVGCEKCRRVTEQRLVGVEEGRFYCAECRSFNLLATYRMVDRRES